MEKRRDYLTLLALRLRVGLGLWFVWSGYQLVFISGLTHFTQAPPNHKSSEAAPQTQGIRLEDAKLADTRAKNLT